MKNKYLKIIIIFFVLLVIPIVILLFVNNNKKFSTYINNTDEEYHEDSVELYNNNCVLSGTEMIDSSESDYILKMCNTITIDNSLFKGTQVSYVLDIVRDDYYDVVTFDYNRKFRIYKNETYEEIVD